MSTEPIQKVAIAGASGFLGKAILDALLGCDQFTVTVLQRASSKSALSVPAPHRVVKVSDDMPLVELKTALEGQDACVCAFKLSADLGPAQRLAEASAAAGVRRFMPPDFGSCDASTEQARHYVPLFGRKVAVQNHATELAASHPGFTWTSLVSGHFFDWGLREGFLHCWLPPQCRADILDSGDLRSSLSTLPQIGRAVVNVLRGSPEALARTANRVLFMQSFCISQNELLASLERATGGAKWEVKRLDSAAYLEERKKAADAGDHDAIEDLVFALGAVDGDWEKKEGFAMDLLGLEEENLDEIVAKIVNETA